MQPNFCWHKPNVTIVADDKFVLASKVDRFSRALLSENTCIDIWTIQSQCIFFNEYPYKQERTITSYAQHLFEETY